MRIVVLGGFGNFGARICRALATDDENEVLAASRSPGDAPRNIATGTRIQRAQLDLASPQFSEALKKLSPRLLIHCAGPFQGQDYRAVSAAICAKAHYIDLADSRDFVANFAKSNDDAARAANVLAVSGASTLPALSSAVVDHLAGRFRSLKEVQTVIAPAQRAPRGAATLAGVFSYAGRPFKWLSGGNWVTAHGWQELRRVRFAGNGWRWAAACDVPDLALFPVRYAGVDTVEFRAALEVGVQHGALWAVAMLRRCGVPFPIEHWAAPLDRMASRLDGLGSERGGMRVSLRGPGTDGTRMRIDWNLVAPANHGPEIPCMAAILLARKIARGEISERGASACMGLLALREFEAEFERWGISTSVDEVQDD